jgi:hypothetical protein
MIMHGKSEFLILFIPFLIIGLGAIYFAFSFTFILFRILLFLVGIICLTIDAFALLVQYVNWKYYKE